MQKKRHRGGQRRAEIDTKRSDFNAGEGEKGSPAPGSLLLGHPGPGSQEPGARSQDTGLRIQDTMSGQDGAIIVSGFHRAMITLTTEMGRAKRSAIEYPAKKKHKKSGRKNWI